MKKTRFMFLSVLIAFLMVFPLMPKAAHAGSSAVQTASTQLDVLAGINRYATAVEISKASYSEANTVILATAWNFPDALAAGPLAMQENAPILLTDVNSIPQSTLDEIVRLKASKVIIMGSEGAVSAAVAERLSGLGITIERVSEANRFGTAVETAKKVRASSGVTDKAILAYGWNFPDALAIGSYAAKEGIPILLTDTNFLTPETRAAIEEFGIRDVKIIGSTGVVSQAVEDELKKLGISVTRSYGSNRFGTSAEIAGTLFPDSQRAVIAYGWNFPDALAAVPLAAMMNSPILLVEQSSIPSAVKNYIIGSQINGFTVVGGEPTVGTSVKDALLNIVNNADMKVSFIDVGQADSILIQTPRGKNVLIDAGNNDDADKVVSYIRSLGIDRLDIVAATHPHEDHIGGLDAVINNFDIGGIYMPKVTTTTQTFMDVITAVSSKGMSIITPVPGSVIDLEQGVSLQIAAPNGSAYSDLNNYSIVFKLTYNNKSFLFTGDAGEVSETEMLSAGYDLNADVLKVGHHGSSSSTTSAFLAAVSPDYAVISVGAGNVYGLPAQSTMDKLKNAGVAVYRTDENGTIVATCDGSSITFSTNPGSFSGSLETNKDIQITDLDLSGEIVRIHNYSAQDQNMTGWKLVSVEGNQIYYFPSNYILKAGASITVASGTAAGDLKWTTAYIWNNAGDSAELYDSNGALISSK